MAVASCVVIGNCAAYIASAVSHIHTAAIIGTFISADDRVLLDIADAVHNVHGAVCDVIIGNIVPADRTGTAVDAYGAAVIHSVTGDLCGAADGTGPAGVHHYRALRSSGIISIILRGRYLTARDIAGAAAYVDRTRKGAARDIAGAAAYVDGP